jgi:DNA polymerase III epsilon subunit-like protein
MKSIVFIDTETTGLSEERDAIIEIRAVKFEGQCSEDEWTLLSIPSEMFHRKAK